MGNPVVCISNGFGKIEMDDTASADSSARKKRVPNCTHVLKHQASKTPPSFNGCAQKGTECLEDLCSTVVREGTAESAGLTYLNLTTSNPGGMNGQVNNNIIKTHSRCQRLHSVCTRAACCYKGPL